MTLRSSRPLGTRWPLSLLFATSFLLSTSLFMAPSAVADVPPRIRVVDGPIAMLLARGAVGSPTFRALLDAIERSDIIAHVSWHERAAGSGRAAMHFVTKTGGYRYVRITLSGRMTTDIAVALLGHELRHARELAEAPWVADVDGYQALYRAIGHPSCSGAHLCFETDDARDAGVQVFVELRALKDRQRRLRAE
jgi:hypothetical protein